MSSHREYLIERAKYMDKLAHTALPEDYSEHRQQAFELRKQARNDPDPDAFERHTDAAIEGSISLMRMLRDSPRLDKSERAMLGRAMNLVQRKHEP